MTQGEDVNLAEADRIAAQIVAQLAPHCERIEIAGSIRRRKTEPNDIEVVAIPKPYDVGLFESGLAKVVNRWPKGELGPDCRYTQRLVPLVAPLEMELAQITGSGPFKVGDVKLDLFLVTPQTWGLQLAVRTGSASFSHKVLAARWSRIGYRGDGGVLYPEDGSDLHGAGPVTFAEEEDLFRFLGVPWVPPEQREVE